VGGGADHATITLSFFVACLSFLLRVSPPLLLQVWSLGVMLWELVTGHPVPYADIRGDLVVGMIVAGVADLRKSLPELPPVCQPSPSISFVFMLYKVVLFSVISCLMSRCRRTPSLHFGCKNHVMLCRFRSCFFHSFLLSRYYPPDHSVGPPCWTCCVRVWSSTPTDVRRRRRRRRRCARP